MLVNHNSRNYNVLPGDSRYPVKLNKKETDEALGKLILAIRSINETMEKLYRENSDLYSLIKDEVFASSSFDFTDGRNWRLKDAENNLSELINYMTSAQDEIPKEEDVLILEDLGFKGDWDNGIHEPYRWEKTVKNETVSDDEEWEDTEEVLWCDNEIYHRIRHTC